MEGALVGALFGTLVMFINGFLSSYGFGGLNIPFQIGGMIIAAVLGDVYGRYTHNITLPTNFFLETAVLGAFIALVYDVITNLGFGLQLILTGEDSSLALFTALANGSFYSLLHIASNSVVFGVLFLPVTKALNSLRVGESPWSKRERLYS
jgi:hypothetical protein